MTRERFVPTNVSAPIPASKELYGPNQKAPGHLGLMIALRATILNRSAPTLENEADAVSRQKQLIALFENPESARLVKEGVRKAMESLKPLEGDALRMYYGLDNPDGVGMTLEEVGKSLKPPVSRARAGQQVEIARRKLRHPFRSRNYTYLLAFPVYKTPNS